MLVPVAEVLPRSRDGRGEMPAEIISDPGCPYDVRVAWGKGQEEVQVSTLCDGVPTGFDRIFGMVNEWLTAAGWQPIDVDAVRKDVAANQKGAVPGFSGWTVDLRHRRQVNRLIRALKRARDDAMGRDE
jgi:hypothetical protein